MDIPLVRLDFALPIPKHHHDGDGGVDLHAREDVSIEPGEWKMVSTGVAVAIPHGFVGLVAPRSGLAARHGISVVNGPGVVDSGYRGELTVILINHGPEAVAIERGERVAQLVVVPVEQQNFVEVEELPDTSRGDGGFGSTGSQ
ncbi:MAG: dUTP diphosphatase [Acidimicrobiia bacterium]|nr:dUTP diphosphatase [Acidimicrobiia bacterium]